MMYTVYISIRTVFQIMNALATDRGNTKSLILYIGCLLTVIQHYVNTLKTVVSRWSKVQDTRSRIRIAAGERSECCTLGRSSHQSYWILGGQSQWQKGGIQCVGLN